MQELYEIEAQLTAEDGPFAWTEEEVLGEKIRVFAERERSLRDLLAKSAAFGDAEYLVDRTQRISFAKHRTRVASVARALAEEYGVAPGDRVAILAANSLEWITTWWACVSLGAIGVGLNGWWARDEIRFGLGDCDPAVLFGDARRLARLEAGDVDVPVVRFEEDFPALLAYAPDAPLPETPLAEDDPASLLYTSGTTGRPKGALNTHRGILAFVQFQMFHGARMMLYALKRGVRPDPDAPPNCMLINAPLFHVSGLYTGPLTAVNTGMKTVWQTGRFDAREVMELIEREQVTNWGPMGAQLHRVANHPERNRFDLSSMRNVGSGGAPVSPETRAIMHDLFPNARRSMGLGYGMTESTSMVTAIFAAELEQHPDSVGRPMPTLEVEIRDEQGRSLADGEEGEICVRGPTVMPGYWRNDGATREAIAPGRWLRTGDVGRLEAGYLVVNSRKRDLILRGGENVYPAEIEQCLERHPEVAEAAVVGVAHAELGQEVKAFVVPVAGASPAEPALAQHVAAHLAYFKVPAHWDLRAEPLPRNATGKILKHVLTGESENPFAGE